MENMSKTPEISVVPHAKMPQAWVVEHVDADDDGGIAFTIFDGCNPKRRAEDYARSLGWIGAP
jgi:hypothetical protein